MKNLKFNIPLFEGFYNTSLDLGSVLYVSDEGDGDVTIEEYENIDWVKTRENVGKRYLNEWLILNMEKLNELGIKVSFSHIKSPKFYNFVNDSLVCNASFDEDVSLRILMCEFLEANNYQKLENVIEKNHSNMDGFISFYSNDPTVWLYELIGPEMDGNVLSTVLEVLTKPLKGYSLYSILQNYSSLIKYKTK